MFNFNLEYNGRKLEIDISHKGSIASIIFFLRVSLIQPLAAIPSTLFDPPSIHIFPHEHTRKLKYIYENLFIHIQNE